MEDRSFQESSIIHGDPVFSNILLSLDNSVKLVDMRGSLDGELTLRGDLMYDLSKVYQSLLGYDFIILKFIPFSFSSHSHPHLILPILISFSSQSTF